MKRSSPRKAKDCTHDHVGIEGADALAPHLRPGVALLGGGERPPLAHGLQLREAAPDAGATLHDHRRVDSRVVAHGEAGTANRLPSPAADCPTAERRIDVYADPYFVPQGGSTKVFGYGFAPGASLQAFLCSTPVPLGTVVADSAGNVEATLGIPAGTPLGVHTIAVVGAAAAGGSQVAYAAIEVTAAGAVAGGAITGNLPTTGSDPGMYVGIGAGLVLLGSAAVFGARRRQQSAA